MSLVDGYGWPIGGKDFLDKSEARCPRCKRLASEAERYNGFGGNFETVCPCGETIEKGKEIPQ